MCHKTLLLNIVSFSLFLGQFSYTSATGLYNSTDNVTIFNGNSLLPVLANSSNLWLIEYYIDWCGHCQEFAPTFKALAKDVAEWCPVITLGVVNCADAENKGLCSQRNVDAVPDLRFHPPYSNASNVGEIFQVKEEIKYLRKGIVEFVEKHITSIDWDYGTPKPDLNPLSFSEAMAFTVPGGSPKNVQHVAIVFEESLSQMGKEIILDMSSCSNIMVRRVLVDSDQGKALATKFLTKPEIPSVVIVSNNGSLSTVNVEMKTRYFYVYKLQRLPGVGEPMARNLVISSKENVETAPGNPEITYKDIDMSVVYLADLESALRYMLTMEVSATKVLEKSKLGALKKMINLFATVGANFPSRSSTVKFFTSLNDWVQPRTNISCDDWLDKVNEKTPGQSLPATNRLWVGCYSNKSTLRGYPCSLWMLFHTLSVAAYKAQIDKQVLPDAMYSYITNFFGCRECRKNFEKEVRDMPFKETGSDYDVILWLWRMHNKVNKRLHEEPSKEDPNFPKVQFPSESLCASCHLLNDEWNEPEVANFLIQRYSKEFMSVDFLDDIKIWPPHKPQNGWIKILDENAEESDMYTDENNTGIHSQNLTLITTHQITAETKLRGHNITKNDQAAEVDTKTMQNGSQFNLSEKSLNISTDSTKEEEGGGLSLLEPVPIPAPDLDKSGSQGQAEAEKDVTDRNGFIVTADTSVLLSSFKSELELQVDQPLYSKQADLSDDSKLSTSHLQSDIFDQIPGPKSDLSSKDEKEQNKNAEEVDAGKHTDDTPGEVDSILTHQHLDLKDEEDLKNVGSLQLNLVSVIEQDDVDNILIDAVVLSDDVFSEGSKSKDAEKIWQDRLDNALLRTDEEENFDHVLSERDFHPRALRPHSQKRSFIKGNFVLGLGFTSTDFSLCLLLWLFSFVAVVLLFILVRSKRAWFNRRFKRHKHSL
ncbi:sulfhydryl oxidase 2-like isoform X2 [Clavelina lepadiformis]|uniref:sulfhydryl oxidase 2-like isoform X2 n=1 Tax=Clavelina lepadiformis TaxID=159417 RepID=UPI0040432A54